MNNFFRLLILIGLIVAGWTYRDKLTKGRDAAAPTEESQPAEETRPATPERGSVAAVPTPHPAREAQAAAAKAYPALGMPNSAFNKKFIALYADAQRNDPALLAQSDWPLKLAERTAVALGGGAMPIPTTPGPLKPLPAQRSGLDKKPGSPH